MLRENVIAKKTIKKYNLEHSAWGFQIYQNQEISQTWRLHLLRRKKSNLQKIHRVTIYERYR